MAIPKPQAQPAPIDPAIAMVRRWPGLRTAKVVYERLWELLGGQAGEVTIDVTEVGEWVDAASPRRSGEHLLASLKKERLIHGTGPGGQIIKKNGRWTFDVVHPCDAHKLRAIGGDPQPDLPFPEEPAINEKPALAPALAPEEILRIGFKEEELINTPPGASAGASAESRLDDPAYLHTVDGLTDLWIETSRVYYGGRKRERRRDRRPEVQETLDCGFAPDVIAAAMRGRENKMEFYNQFHERLLRQRREKAAKPTSDEIAAAVLAKIEAAKKEKA